jgi:hypothetical protein
MQKHKYVIFVTLFFIFFLIGCENNEPTPEEKAQVRAIGDQASDVLLRKLKSRLISAVQKSGPAGAINECKLDAIKLTHEATNNSKVTVAVKRVTNKYRNPINAPDEWDKKALTFFENKEGVRDYFPEFYVQKIQQDEAIHFRYYKPLKMYQMCLKCHGNKIKEDVRVRLNELYPNDLATGYAKGDFRGAIRVDIAKEYLQ